MNCESSTGYLGEPRGSGASPSAFTAKSRHQGIPEPIGRYRHVRGESTSRKRRFLGTLGLQPIYSHLPSTAQKPGIVVTSPTRTRVEPTAFRCSALRRSARRRTIPAPAIARVAIMNASSGRLSWISFTIVQIVEFARRSNRRNAAPVARVRLAEI